MSIFTKVALKDHENDSRLGLPTADQTEMDRKLHLMSTFTGGKGFRIPAKEPRVWGDGKTRGQRKREARAKFIAKFKANAERAPDAVSNLLDAAE